MNYTEYISQLKNKTPLLKSENLLFWDLWCLSYVFEKLDQDSQFYPAIDQCYKLLWQINDSGNIDLILSNEFDAILNFDNDEFDDLNLTEVSDVSLKEMIIGIESIVLNLREDAGLVYNAYESPINVIDVEIDGISITKDNTSSIYCNEVNAQIKLLDDLIQNHSRYTRQHRNIYRQ